MIRVFVFAMIWVCMVGGIASAQEKKKPEAGPNIYMPYARSRDHLVVGVEISGYHMRYDIAQEYDFFMALLPDKYNSLDDAPVYFAINTFPFDGYTVKQTLENDLKALKKSSKRLKITKRMDAEQIPKAGECYGAEVAYPEAERQFPYESFYFCKSRSKKYAIMMTLGAKTKKDLEKHMPSFLVWANAPQIVKDAKIIIEK